MIHGERNKLELSNGNYVYYSPPLDDLVDMLVTDSVCVLIFKEKVLLYSTSLLSKSTVLNLIKDKKLVYIGEL